MVNLRRVCESFWCEYSLFVKIQPKSIYDPQQASLSYCGGPSQGIIPRPCFARSEEHTSELQSQSNLVCRLLLEKKNLRVDQDQKQAQFFYTCVHKVPERCSVPVPHVIVDFHCKGSSY